MNIEPGIQPLMRFLQAESDRWSRLIINRVLSFLKRAFPWAAPCPCPAGAGGWIASRPREAVQGPLLMRGGRGEAGPEQRADLEEAIRFVLTMKRQCGIYLYSTTKAAEFIYMGSPTMVCEDEADIHKYMDSVESLFSATFNTFNELLCRDAVHRRVGMRMTAEEYYDLNMFDRVHKLIRFILLVFQVLCQTQTAFKNVPIPARLEMHISG